MNLPWISDHHAIFPPPHQALSDPDGLLAVGGMLSTDTLLTAYRQGIFPWYEEPQPILWWLPSDRAILVPGNEHVSKSLAKFSRKKPFTITTNQAFSQVIRACAAPRAKADGTWITNTMASAYIELHKLGFAHSVECWQQNKLVGGLYGVQVGSVFCGESMFSRVTNASKLAFISLSQTLAKAGFTAIDCQLENPHLTSLGVEITSRQHFLTILSQGMQTQLHWPNTFT